MNRENLQRLAEVLSQVSPKTFDMDYWLLVGGHTASLSGSFGHAEYINECGTCACALGHAALAGIGHRSFGTSWLEYGHVTFDLSGRQFDWLFGPSWAKKDNSKEGAIARIRYLLAGHPIPPIDEFDPELYEGYLPAPEIVA